MVKKILVYIVITIIALWLILVMLDKDVKTNSYIIISVSTLVIAYSQMRIASAKIRMDLYGKRFNVYLAALDYYQATWDKGDVDVKDMEDKAKTLVKSFRESRYLFTIDDGVAILLKKMIENGGTIVNYEGAKRTRNGADIIELKECAMNARISFENDLIKLEKILDKYLQFRTISGWHWKN